MAIRETVADEPVRTGLNGIGITVNAVVVLLQLFGVTDFTAVEILELVAAVQILMASAAEIVRQFVTPNGKVVSAYISVRDRPGQ